MIDILRARPFLQSLSMDYNNCPALAHILRRNTFFNCQATYYQAIQATLKIAKDTTNVELLETEDPWIILWVLRSYLEKYAKPGRTTFPILASPCGCG